MVCSRNKIINDIVSAIQNASMDELCEMHSKFYDSNCVFSTEQDLFSIITEAEEEDQ